MYNPPKLGIVDGDELEFLELKNTGAAPLELTGVRFTDGIHFAYRNSADGSGWTNLVRFGSVPTNRTVTNLLGPSATSRFFRLVTPRLP